MNASPDAPSKRTRVVHESCDDERWVAHAREHEMLAEFADERRMEMNRRLDEMNMLRRQIETERSEFVRAVDFKQQHAALVAMVERVQRTVWMGMGGLMAVITLAGILASVLRHG